MGFGEGKKNLSSKRFFPLSQALTLPLLPNQLAYGFEVGVVCAAQEHKEYGFGTGDGAAGVAELLQSDFHVG